MGRARDGAPLVVATLVDGAVLVAARRTGPVPSDRLTDVRAGWQVAVLPGPVEAAFDPRGVDPQRPDGVPLTRLAPV